MVDFAKPKEEEVADPPLQWLCRWQIQRWPYAKIAKHYDVDETTVRDGVESAAKLVGLTLRKEVLDENQNATDVQ
ncbi:hypothetical protein LCGC14_2755090 [marine sediment metagenome]|uniref:Uncharacterized protein n=1 Tax=marine sediment metagenome TaxID=412755 RepID=A0A0F9BS98_9ZZZZ